MAVWIYAPRLPALLRKSGLYTIRVRYPAPIGAVTLHVRDNDGSDAFILSEVFDHRYYDFDLPFEPETILDLGANAGFSAVFFGRKYPHAALACVEPVAPNAELLRCNTKANGVEATVFEAAISTADGPVEMALAPNDYGHRLVEQDAKPPAQTYRCEGRTVASVMDALGWDRISLVKIDIEGYELHLLQENSAWLGRTDAVCIELHPGFDEADLARVGIRYGFGPSVRLPGDLMLLVRATS
jgi:FkbM family methyltransferase